MKYINKIYTHRPPFKKKKKNKLKSYIHFVSPLITTNDISLVLNDIDLENSVTFHLRTIHINKRSFL